MSTISDVFFLFLGPEGGISVFFGDTLADLDFIRPQAEYPEELDERLQLGLKQYWPQHKTVTFPPKTELRQMVVVPTFLREQLEHNSVIASQEYLRNKVQSEPPLFFRPELVLNNLHVQSYFP